jgi:tetratricopeptide (TPR) repeat protein
MKFGKEDKLNKLDDDEIVEPETDNTIIKMQHYIYKNSKMISIISIAVILLVAGIFIGKNIWDKTSDENAQKASVALDRIIPYYDAPDYKKALFGDSARTVRGEKIIGLLDIVDQFEGTKQGKIAALYAGNSYLALNKADEAIEFFEIATKSASKVVLAGAYAGLGASYELLGNYEDAVSNFVMASEYSLTDITIARYNYYAGLNYEKLGKKENAINLYNEIIAKNKFNEFGNLAKAGLVRLGMKID